MLYIMNPPHYRLYSVLNREISLHPGGYHMLNLRPARPSTSSTASVTGLRKCRSTLNRMGKYGCLRSLFASTGTNPRRSPHSEFPHQSTIGDLRHPESDAHGPFVMHVMICDVESESIAATHLLGPEFPI